MSLKRLVLYLLLAFLVVFVIKSPNEAAKVVKAAGENAGEWFSTASTAFSEFLKSLV
jgi:hypothetical protein